MKNMTIHCLLAALALLAAPVALNANEAPPEREVKRNFLREIAGPGGTVAIRNGPYANGEDGWIRMGMDQETGEPIFESEGRVDLRTSDLHLIANRLAYNPQDNRLTAVGEIQLETDAFTARSRNLEYRTDTGAVRLDGAPFVRQTTATNITTFDGMDDFVVQDTEDGMRLITLDGTRTITIEMTPLEGAEAAPEAAEAEGFAKLGSQMKLTVNPRGEIRPKVRSHVNAEGELVLFSASGSVVMNTDEFNLRCDEMNFYADRQRFEAVGNVFLSKEGVQADAGRMVYDLESGRITLSVRPDVRSTDDDGSTIRLQDYDQVIVTPAQTDGYPDVQGVGSAGLTTLE